VMVMPCTQKLLSSGRAFGFHTKAASTTVNHALPQGVFILLLIFRMIFIINSVSAFYLVNRRWNCAVWSKVPSIFTMKPLSEVVVPTSGGSVVILLMSISLGSC
jgi:hypothetical protein